MNKPGGSVYYRLYVAVSDSLQQYYSGKTHRLSSNSDFAKFVTPYALAPIATSLEQIYSDDEDFANGVLMIVHQIPYEVTLPAKYPVETIVDNKGDCDLFSFIAASIMMAHGLDVVLLYYESETHMNIGVRLSHAPADARDQAFYVTHNGNEYYVAECTGGNWQTGWRVGECPDMLKNASVQVITTENSEQIAPGQVSSSYQMLASSSISLNVSPSGLVLGNTVAFSGQITPALGNETVTIYMRANSLPWQILGTAKTDSYGRYAFVWDSGTIGIYDVRASWSGNEQYGGADSPIQSITILSTMFVVLLVVVIVMACVGLFVYIASRQTQTQIPNPQPPESFSE
jgi:hypothetical protein